MKKILSFLCIFFFSVSAFSKAIVEKKYYESHPELGGDVIINKKIQEVKDGKSFCTFEINVPNSGNYYLNFWMCPAKLSDGSYSTYDVLANDSYIGKINPTCSDWQNISFGNGRTIYLQNGISTISIVGNLTDCPIVESIRLSTSFEKAKFSDTAYREYKKEIIRSSQLHKEEYKRRMYENPDTLNAQEPVRTVSFPMSPQTNPSYDAAFVDVAVSKKIQEVKDGKSFCTFEINVPNSGNYYLNFWMCPVKLSDGSYSTYDVLANDSYIGKINPTCSDWQNISFGNGRTIYLQNGISTISIVGSLTDCPTVESIRLSTDYERANFSDTAYREYKEEIIKNSQLQKEENKDKWSENPDTLNTQDPRRTISFPLSPQTNPPYDAKFMLGAWFNYTFFTSIYLTQGQNVSISTTGIDNYPHVLELFHEETPELYSWSSLSNAYCQTSLNPTIQETGYYMVRVRSYYNATLGMCNLNINNQTYLDSIPVYSNGIRGEKDTQNYYNSFTSYNTGDPMIWVEEYGTPGRITAYNDDYYSGTYSVYSWGINSRVIKQYSSTSNAVLISCYSSYTPSNRCDFYINCPKISTSLSTMDYYLRSAPSTSAYNCISWSGGVYTEFIWPPSDFSGISSDALETFDYFYGATRYNGCGIFTRQGATEENSCIDLWALVDANGNRTYMHASVRKGADDNAHGFDWESKLGHNVRIYHPRYYVPVSSYGQVVEHYRLTGTGQCLTLEEAIANGTDVIENVQFTEDEARYLDSQIGSIDPNILSGFYSRYQKWQQIWDTSLFSNPDQIADCDEYRDLLSYCIETPKLVYPIFKILGEGNVSTVCLLKDLTLTSQVNKALLEKIHKENKEKEYDDNGVHIVRTIQSNAMLYVKELIKEEVEKSLARNGENKTTGISYSNSNPFAVRSSDRGLALMFDIDQPTRIHADVIDLKGTVITEFVRNRILFPNSYEFECKLAKGNYLVRYVVNGNVNVRKIHID